MSTSALISARFETLRTVAFGGIGVAYAVLGVPLANPARIIILSNSTDQPVFISTDGVNNHLYLAANSFKLIDVSANKSTTVGFYFRQGTQFWVVRAAGAPTIGAVWFETVYAG